MTEKQAAKRVLGLIREGVEFSEAVASIHVEDRHVQTFGRCIRCDRFVDEAYGVDDEAMDAALIAEVGVERIAEIAVEEGIAL